MPENIDRDAVIEKVLSAAVTEQRRARRWGIFFKFITLIYIGAIIALFVPRELGLPGSAEAHVAVVKVMGAIQAEEAANAEDINKSLKQAFENKMAKAVVLRINSPGGTAVQAAQVYDEIRRLKKKYPNKKIYAVIEDMGASGAYYIASATDAIYANRSSFVGSIGALIKGFGFTELLQRIGVERRVYKAGSEKTLLDPFLPVSEDEAKMATNMVEQVHQQFIQAVKQGRGARLKNNADLFTGRVWTGEQAKELGLIDGFGSLSDVARDVVKVDKLVDYTESTGLFERISQQVGSEVGHAMTSAFRTRVSY
jgi:protease-4